MRDPRLQEFESRLKEIFDRIDRELENTYGSDYPLHPARSGRGQTGNPEQDGLFNVGASFSAGYGSEYGKGYIVDVEMVTLAHVPNAVREKIEREVAEKLDRMLPEYFPERKLTVDRDRNVYKIHGDIRLGTV